MYIDPSMRFGNWEDDIKESAIRNASSSVRPMGEARVRPLTTKKAHVEVLSPLEIIATPHFLLSLEEYLQVFEPRVGSFFSSFKSFSAICSASFFS